MYEKKVECLLLPKAMAEKNVTSDENWIFSTGIGFNFCACNLLLPAKGKSECEECDSFTRVGSFAGTIGIFFSIFYLCLYIYQKHTAQKRYAII